MTIKLKRIYENPLPEDGYRVLVDRLWARGMTKEKAAIDEWDKDIAPSDQLRKWFHHDLSMWKEFSEKYLAELKSGNSCQDFLKRNAKQEIITLVYVAKDEQHCHPLILKKYLDRLISGA